MSTCPGEIYRHVEVRLGPEINANEFRDHVSPGRKPVLYKGLDIGPAQQKWAADYLSRCPSAVKTVSVHATDEPSGCLDFVNKNFKFLLMDFGQLVQLCAGLVSSPNVTPLRAPVEPESSGNGVKHRFFYLRTVGSNPRKEPSQLSVSFPELADDIKLPQVVPPQQHFSTVLRISSPGLRLWTHYDVMDNFLIQVQGHKEVLLWPPEAHDNLYIQGSSSPIINVDEPDLLKYPKFAEVAPLKCTLGPGDVLFIPSLWFHNVLAQDFSVSVNVFWRHLPTSFYERKDLYGNRDLVPANLADQAAEEVVRHLKTLPHHYRAFYTRRLLSRVHQSLDTEEDGCAL